MKNHIKLTKLKLKLAGYKVTTDPFEVEDEGITLITPLGARNLKKYHDGELIYYFKKHERRVGVMKANGEKIIDYRMVSILDASKDIILIYDEFVLAFKGISVATGERIFTVKAYGREEARLEKVIHFDGDSKLMHDGTTYAVMLDAEKRYRIITEQGFEVASKLISYKKVLASSDNAVYLALRYEDGFGLLNDKCEVTKCNNITALVANQEIIESFSYYISPRDFLRAPVILGRYYPKKNESDKIEKREEYFSYAGLNGKVIDDIMITKVLNKGLLPCYLVKKHIEDCDESKYNFIDRFGNVIFENGLYDAKPLVSNRAFVKINKDDEYWTLIDEDGRIISSEYKIVEIIESFEKVEYGSFEMTLARVKDENLGIIRIDKELHYYPDLV